MGELCDIPLHKLNIIHAASRHLALTHASGLLHTDCAQSRAAAPRAGPQTSAGSGLLPQGRAPPASVSTAGPPGGAAAPVTCLSRMLGMNVSSGTHTALGTLSAREMMQLCETEPHGMLVFPLDHIGQHRKYCCKVRDPRRWAYSNALMRSLYRASL